MPQLSVSIDMAAVGFPGQLVDIHEVKDVVTALATEAVPYGCAVVKVSGASFDKMTAKLPTSSSEVTTLGSVMGVVLADQARAQDPSVVSAQYPAQSALSVLKKGRVWVLVEEAVVAGDAAFVRFAAGTGTQKGAFRKSADTATAVALPGHFFETSASAGGYAVLNMNLA